MKTLSTTILLFLSFIWGDQHTQQEIYFYKTSVYKAADIDSIAKVFNTGAFKKETDFKLSQVLNHDVYWMYIPIQNNLNTDYFSVNNPYLPYGRVYVKTKNKIIELHKVEQHQNFGFEKLFYRNPAWKIKEIKNKEGIFLEVKNRFYFKDEQPILGSNNFVRLKYDIDSENSFFKRMQIEYVFISAFSTFLICMGIIPLFFSVYRNDKRTIFYTAYTLCMLIDFLAAKGVGVQFLWNDSYFLTTNIKSIVSLIGVISMGQFYLIFYKKLKRNSVNYKIFQWGSYVPIPILVIYIYKYIFGGLDLLFLYVWTTLNIVILFFLCNHVYLGFKRKLPKYLTIAFITPMLGILIMYKITPSNTSPFIITFLNYNLFYVTIVIELLLISWYIFDNVIQTERDYQNLKKINNDLKYVFHNNLIESQNKERNRLLSDVHDSLGGYIEALKLRLKTAQKNEKITHEILDEFHKEYRFLLNDLYSPKIDTHNFIENLEEYCSKINQITNNMINYDFEIDQTNSLSQDKCIHLYRIISEIITNAIKHSKATKIEFNIFLQKSTQNLLINIKDNGVGFDISKISKGYGLINLEERITIIDGVYYINSILNEGTAISITLPCQNQK